MRVLSSISFIAVISTVSGSGRKPTPEKSTKYHDELKESEHNVKPMSASAKNAGYKELKAAKRQKKKQSPDSGSRIFSEIVDCISPSSDAKSLLCMLKKGLPASLIRSALLSTPDNVAETSIPFAGGSLKAWRYLSSVNHPSSIILLPGMGGHQGLLRELGRSLMANFNVYSMDTVGYGSTEGQCPLNMMEAAIESVEAMMQQFTLSEESTILVGHSLGGIVAQNFGAKHPTLMGVVNIDGDSAIIQSEPEDDPEDSHVLLAELMSYDPMVIQELMDLSKEIKTEISGACHSWHAWLDSWYEAGGWQKNFASLIPRTLFIKATESPSSLAAWKGILTEYFNLNRGDRVRKVEVVAVVSTHAKIVLTGSSIDEVSRAIAQKFHY